MHRLDPAGAAISQVGDLNRGRRHRERAQPIARRVQRQVDQNVDSIGSDLLRQTFIAQRGDLARLIAASANCSVIASGCVTLL